MSQPLRFPGGTQQLMVRVPRDQYDSLRAIHERDGVPMAEQIRRAIAAWLDERQPRLKKGR